MKPLRCERHKRSKHRLSKYFTRSGRRASGFVLVAKWRVTLRGPDRHYAVDQDLLAKSGTGAVVGGPAAGKLPVTQLARCKRLPSAAHRSASQYQVNMHSAATTRSYRYGAIVSIETAGLKRRSENSVG